MSEKLSEKQQRFVEEYLVDGNATQAAIRAGYSKKTAKSIATENLSKPAIKDAISRARGARSERVKVTVDMVVTEIWKLYQLCSVRIPKQNFEGEQERDENGNPVFKAVDAVNAKALLDMLMKHLGAYSLDNKREVEGDIMFTWGAGKNE